MTTAKKPAATVWCAGCLTDHMLAAGKAKAQQILIRVVRHDFRVKQDTCSGCGKKRLTIDLKGRRRKPKPKPPVP